MKMSTAVAINAIHNKQTIGVEISNERITHQKVHQLADELGINGSVVQLCITNTDLDDFGALALSSLFKTDVSLELINLNSNHITDNGAKCLIDSLSTNKTICALLLDGNEDITNEYRKAIEALIKRNNKLYDIVAKALRTYDQTIVQKYDLDDSVKLLQQAKETLDAAEYPKNAIRYIKLIVAINHLNEILASRIVNLKKMDSSTIAPISGVEINGNSITGRGLNASQVSQLADALTWHGSVEQLSISDTLFDKDMASKLDDVLRTDTSLELLNLSNSRFSDEDAQQHLIFSLSLNKTIIQLLMENEAGNDSMPPAYMHLINGFIARNNRLYATIQKAMDTYETTLHPKFSGSLEDSIKFLENAKRTLDTEQYPTDTVKYIKLTVAIGHLHEIVRARALNVQADALNPSASPEALKTSGLSGSERSSQSTTLTPALKLWGAQNQVSNSQLSKRVGDNDEALASQPPSLRGNNL